MTRTPRVTACVRCNGLQDAADASQATRTQQEDTAAGKGAPDRWRQTPTAAKRREHGDTTATQRSGQATR
ncbi:hypothetical protein GCM10010404_72430 [Nonomuraea africana]